MAIKTALWKCDGPVTDLSDVELEIIDKETGEFIVKGANLLISMNHVFMLRDKAKPTEPEEVSEEPVTENSEIPNVEL
jgi:hypothetical protein